MINIAVCDDQYAMHDCYASMFSNLQINTSVPYEIKYFFDGIDLVEQYEKGIFYDVIFLDIEMEELDGVETALVIRTYDPKAIIVYVSSYDKYCRDLFKVNPFDFLLKPIRYEVFQVLISNILHKLQKEQKHYFSFQLGKEFAKIPNDEIIYFESRKRKIMIHTKAKSYCFYGKLDEVENQILGIKFFRIHKSYLVNPTYIRVFRINEIELYNNQVLAISENKRKEIKEKLMQEWKTDNTK